MHLCRYVSTAGVWIVLLLSCPAARATPVMPEPAVAGSAGSSVVAVLEQVSSLREKNPDAALRRGEPAGRAGPPGREHNELGLALMAAAATAEQPQKVLEIGERLRWAALTPAQRLRRFNFLTCYAWAAHDPARVKALEPEVAALEKQQPGQAQAIATLWQQIAAAYTLLDDSADAMRTARHGKPRPRPRPRQGPRPSGPG